MNCLDGKTLVMTLETAERLVLEQGDQACKEARAVVRGGMVICERAEDGRRIYPWIKVKPTITDEESSIEEALKNHQEKKRLSTTRTMTINSLPTSADVKPSTPIQTTIDFPKEDECANTKRMSPIMELFNYLRKKFLEFVKAMDEIVQE